MGQAVSDMVDSCFHVGHDYVRLMVITRMMMMMTMVIMVMMTMVMMMKVMVMMMA